MDALLDAYAAVFIGLIAGFVLVFSALAANFVLAPKSKSHEKSLSYECGMVPISRAQTQISLRFYIFAILFLIFDVEAVFLFPWAVSFVSIGAVSTVVSLVAFLVLRNPLGAIAANALALSVTAGANAWANRRYTLGRRGPAGRRRDYRRAAAIYLVTLTVSSLLLMIVDAPGAGLGAQLGVLSATWGGAALARYRSLTRRRTARQRSARQLSARRRPTSTLPMPTHTESPR